MSTKKRELVFGLVLYLLQQALLHGAQLKTTDSECY